MLFARFAVTHDTKPFIFQGIDTGYLKVTAVTHVSAAVSDKNFQKISRIVSITRV